MKHWLLTVFAASVTSVFCHVGLWAWDRSQTVWQYDHWRAAYHQEQVRKAREAWLAAEFAKTNKVPLPAGMFYATNFLMVSSNPWIGYTVRFGFNPLAEDKEWLPNFQRGEVELGYRKDGAVVYRTPPELSGVPGWKALRDDVVELARRVGTNVLGTNFGKL